MFGLLNPDKCLRNVWLDLESRSTVVVLKWPPIQWYRGSSQKNETEELKNFTDYFPLIF